jgi:hypothetical protein
MMAEEISRRLLTAEVRVRARISPFGICCEEISLGQGFLRVFRFSPVSIILSWLALHAHISPGGCTHNKPVDGSSSETTPHPISMNKNNEYVGREG